MSSGIDITADFNVPLTAVDPGIHALNIRGMNDLGRWTFTSHYSFLKIEEEVLPDVTYIEYFLDIDPGFGAGNSLA